MWIARKKTFDVDGFAICTTTLRLDIVPRPSTLRLRVPGDWASEGLSPICDDTVSLSASVIGRAAINILVDEPFPDSCTAQKYQRFHRDILASLPLRYAKSPPATSPHQVIAADFGNKIDLWRRGFEVVVIGSAAAPAAEAPC
jgi:hypothetical protein